MSGQIRVSSELLFDDNISPLIYGDFIELLNDLIPGMWSEKIVDRNFAGVLQPNYVFPPGTNWVYPRWTPIVCGQPRFDRWFDSHADTDTINAAADLQLDSDNPFIGQQSAKVSVQNNDNRPFIAGIAQTGISVKQGQRLNLELYLRGSDMKDTLVKVCIGRNYGVFFRSYDEIEFKGITENWQKFTGTLIPEVSDSDATIAIGINKGTFWVDKVSLMPEDNLNGWRPDVIDAIRAMKPGIIRFGGSSLIFYQWQDGIGPREKRAPFVNYPWGNMEENDVGLHEFLQFCELVNAEPLICLNSNSATLEQIMDEIEYCNGSVDTHYGSIRAEMGHPEPFNVKYWQIGNEQLGEEYEKTMANYAGAIRERYPNLTLLASYPSDNILSNLSGEIDYVCPHFYAPYTKYGENELLGLIEKIQKDAKNKNLKLGITEWNHTAGSWEWGRSWLLTLYNALNAARMYNMYHRLGDMVKIANRSNMTNSCCSGVIQTNRAGDIYFTPCYYVQKAYANLSGDKALKTYSDENDPLDISATKRENEIALFVVNYLGQAYSREIDISSLNISDDLVNVWTLSGDSFEVVNSFQEKNNVVPVESVIEFKGNTFEYEFPAYSVTIFRFKGK
jgi:alpha-N-arabinofuranosidase